MESLPDDAAPELRAAMLRARCCPPVAEAPAVPEIIRLQRELAEMSSECDELRRELAAARAVPMLGALSVSRVKRIKQIVAATYGIDLATMLSFSHEAEVVLPRHVAMYLTKKFLPGFTKRRIARLFGRTDHSTVVNALQRIEDKRRADGKFDAKLTRLEATIMGWSAEHA